MPQRETSILTHWNTLNYTQICYIRTEYKKNKFLKSDRKNYRGKKKICISFWKKSHLGTLLILWLNLTSFSRPITEISLFISFPLKRLSKITGSLLCYLKKILEVNLTQASITPQKYCCPFLYTSRFSCEFVTKNLQNLPRRTPLSFIRDLKGRVEGTLLSW